MNIVFLFIILFYPILLSYISMYINSSSGIEETALIHKDYDGRHLSPTPNGGNKRRTVQSRRRPGVTCVFLFFFFSFLFSHLTWSNLFADCNWRDLKKEGGKKREGGSPACSRASARLARSVLSIMDWGPSINSLDTAIDRRRLPPAYEEEWVVKERVSIVALWGYCTDFPTNKQVARSPISYVSPMSTWPWHRRCQSAADEKMYGTRPPPSQKLVEGRASYIYGSAAMADETLGVTRPTANNENSWG